MSQWLPLIGLAAFIGIGAGWRTWLQWRRYGASGFALFRSGRWSQHVRDSLVLLLVAVLTAESVAKISAPGLLDRLGLLTLPPLVTIVGVLLMLAGTALMVVAQLDLGASWRIGIEEGARPGLVAKGFYRFCRNPIFLSMLIVLVGFLLLVPTLLSLIIVACTFLGVHRQVRDEEAYLLRTYGPEYAAYASTVGRFLPGLGRFAQPETRSRVW